MEKRLVIILIALAFVSCSKDEYVVETRDLDPFSGIFIQNSFDVVFHRDTNTRIVLSGSSDILEKVEIIPYGDSIIIENNFKAKWLRPTDHPVKLDIYCDSLSFLLLKESCDVSSTSPLRSDEIGIIAESRLNIVDLEFDATTVFYWNNFPCNGTMTFRGRADELKIWNTALMQVDASQLDADYVLVENDSGEDCRVHCNDILEYAITGAGDIIVTGNPEVLPPTDSGGTGQLIIVE